MPGKLTFRDEGKPPRLRDAFARATYREPALLGLGTAPVYPTLIAAISDAVSPSPAPPVVGIYRFWRDLGYAAGAVIAGGVADALGYGGAIGIVDALTAASGLWVLADMPARPDALAAAGGSTLAAAP